MANEFGSLEVYFTYPSDTSKVIQLVTDVKGIRQFGVGPEIYEDVSVHVSSTQAIGDYLFIQVELLLGTTVVDRSDYRINTFDELTFAVRIFFFDQYISVHVNDYWVYSYALAKVDYPEPIAASLKLDGATTTITDIRRVELADGREAIFVDYEATTDSAIQSIIQQRPILVVPHVNRKISFTYKAEKDTVTAVFVNRYSDKTTHPPQMSSDGLVYGNDVGVSIDTDTARDVGFITRLYRLPELNTGAVSAAGTQQLRARQQRNPQTVNMRLDPRLEVMDVLHLDLVVKGTNRHIDRQIIIESFQINLRDGDYNMNISGRKKS